MSDLILLVVGIAMAIISVVSATVYAIKWFRQGGHIPRYIHGMAALATLLGLVLSLVGQSWLLAALFPAIVYSVFVLKGGPWVARALPADDAVDDGTHAEPGRDRFEDQ